MLVNKIDIVFPVARGVFMISKRSVTRDFYYCAPPMRYLTAYHKIGLFFFCFGSILAYPTYVLMNLDNVRPIQQAHFSDELREKLEERRRLRAEGKLNVLQKKL